MKSFARPLERYSSFRTLRIEEMRAALAQVRPMTALEPEDREAALDATLNHCRLQHVALNYGTYGAAVRMQFPEVDVATKLFVIRGAGEVVVGSRTVSIAPNIDCAISANVKMKMRVSEDYERINLSIDMPALLRKLRALTGSARDDPLELKMEHDAGWPSQYLRDFFLHFVRFLDAAENPPALLLAEMEQALIVAFLYGNHHNYSALLNAKSEDVAPWQVRRAEEYIEANWHRQIAIEDVAQAAGTSIRSLFRSFRQARGYSPMAFVKQLRLERAHQALKSAETATTVTRVAFECGFSEVGRFSGEYRSKFGELPSETLRRARGSVRRRD